MKTTIFTVLIITCFICTAQSQNTILTIYDFQQYMTSSGEFAYLNSRDTEIKGSPFLNENFEKGMIRIENNWYSDIELRYDAFNGQLQAKLEKGVIVLDPTLNPVDSIKLGEDTFVKTLIESDNSRKLAFLVALPHKGEVSILKKYKVAFQPAKAAGAYGDAKAASYSMVSPDYYLAKGDESLVAIKSLKSIAEYFETDSKALKSFTKKNKLNVNKEEDLIKIISHLD